MFSYGIIIRWKHFISFNPKRHNNKIAIKCRNSKIITTVTIQRTDQGGPHITQMLILKKMQCQTIYGLSRTHDHANKNRVDYKNVIKGFQRVV